MLHGPLQQEVAGRRVLESSAGLEEERIVRVDRLTVRQSGRMREDVSPGHPLEPVSPESGLVERVSQKRLDGLLWQVLHQWRVQVQHALLHEPHDRIGKERFGEGRRFEQRLARDRFSGLRALHSKCSIPHHAPVVDNRDGEPRDPRLAHEIGDACGEVRCQRRRLTVEE